MSVLKHVNPHVMKVSPYQPGRPIEEVARELGLDPDDIIKLASNESPLGPSPKAMRAMKKACSEMHLYPDGGAYYLRKRISEHYGFPPDHFIFGCGSNELIEFIGHSFLYPGVSAVMSEKAFVIYKIICGMFGAEVIEAPMKGLTHNLRAIRKAIKDNTRVVFICNPNNPTGTMVRDREVRKFMEKVPDDVLVVFDEAYAEITYKRMPDTLSFVRENRNVIVLRSFSKAYGLAGLRVGYGIAKPEIIHALEKPRQPFNLSRMAQIAATAALDDQSFVRRSRRTYKKGAHLIMKACSDMKLVFEPPVANFILIKVGNGFEVFNELQKKGVIVRPMGPYNLPEWIRVSIGKENENIRFLSALKTVVSS
ncbi:MAG TPA: histidinol-phosphate transaminase [Lentisphaeria bacterium]|nr:MAG: histidinol-phosphate transaminase [Lentisphaerae bacterium GWF2_49_21]HBC87473.1 histidinol-phosphate transaminase [Lentisphaeria bacterium]